jgi:Zn-dependent membrane protease YugP
MELTLLPYIAFLIFFVSVFLLTTESSLVWLSENCSSLAWTFFILSLIIGCLAFIWTGYIIKCKH